jgi:hypothetical protein
MTGQTRVVHTVGRFRSVTCRRDLTHLARSSSPVRAGSLVCQGLPPRRSTSLSLLRPRLARRLTSWSSSHDSGSDDSAHSASAVRPARRRASTTCSRLNSTWATVPGSRFGRRTGAIRPWFRPVAARGRVAPTLGDVVDGPASGRRTRMRGRRGARRSVACDEPRPTRSPPTSRALRAPKVPARSRAVLEKRRNQIEDWLRSPIGPTSTSTAACSTSIASETRDRRYSSAR